MRSSGAKGLLFAIACIAFIPSCLHICIFSSNRKQFWQIPIYHGTARRKVELPKGAELHHNKKHPNIQILRVNHYATLPLCDNCLPQGTPAQQDERATQLQREHNPTPNPDPNTQGETHPTTVQEHLPNFAQQDSRPPDIRGRIRHNEGRESTHFSPGKSF